MGGGWGVNSDPTAIGSDVDRVELFLTHFQIFRRRFDGIVIYFFDSDFKFFDDASEFSVTSLYVVFFPSKFMSVFLQVRFL